MIAYRVNVFLVGPLKFTKILKLKLTCYFHNYVPSDYFPYSKNVPLCHHGWETWKSVVSKGQLKSLNVPFLVLF